MIDRSLLKDDPQKVIENIGMKEPGFDVAKLIELDAQVRHLQIELEQLRKQKNDLAQQAKGGITPQLREQSIEVGKKLKTTEQAFDETHAQFEHLYLSCPNLIDASVPPGTAADNQVVKEFGQQPSFDFAIKNHLELGTQLGWLDFETAAKTTGSQFALYKGDAVRLMYALTMFMLKNNIKHGYAPVLPPYLVSEESLTVASNFPKFKDQVYAVPEDNLFLTPTAEVNLANMYRKEILAGEQLPLRMTAWTSCFRREAGGYGATERGLIRLHQFEKVELFTLSAPEHSMQELDRMVACAEDILQALGLHYRISLLAAQDCSFPSAKTYDIEVWMPGQKVYSEVSSCSNCTDFQSRRGQIRYRPQSDAKPHLVHTLNASSLALPRLMVAIMETFQQADGTITIPDVLKTEGIF